MSSIFISYSRKDIEFARQVVDALAEQKLDTWIDWQSIPKGEDWKQEIDHGIEEAETFIFLMSPDSAKSEICNLEIAHALENNKRIIPIVIRDTNPQDFHFENSGKEISRRNWIFCRNQTDNFDNAIQDTIETIHTDYEWVKHHTKLQVRALEWQRSDQERSLLYRGKELEDAEFQLATNTSKDPIPTDLQHSFILKSRQGTDRQRRIVTGIAIAGVIALTVLATFGFLQAGLARNAEATAKANEAAAQTAQADAESESIQRATAQANAEASAEEALYQAKTARAGELAAYSESLKESELPLSILLSIEAGKMAKTYRTKKTILQSLQANQRFFFGHSNIVNNIAFNPDGRILASSSFDDTIILWDVETGHSIGQLLSEHDSLITSIAFNPDGNSLLSGSYDGTLTSWDIKSKQPTSLQIKELTRGVRSLAISPDGKIIALGTCGNYDLINSYCLEGETILWNIEAGQQIGEPLIGHPNWVGTIAFSPDGKTLASGSEEFEPFRTDNGDNSFIILWDVESQTPIGQPLIGTIGPALSVTFSPDGRTLAAGSSGRSSEISEADNTGINNTITLWDIETHQIIRQITREYSNSVFSIDFSPDGKTIASGGCKLGQFTCIEGETIVWDIETGLAIGQPSVKHTNAIYNVAFSPNGEILASSSGDGSEAADIDDNIIILWDVNMHLPISKVLTKKPKWVTSVIFSPDGETLASGSCRKFGADFTCIEGETILWDINKGLAIGPPLTGPKSVVRSVAFSPDGKTIASSGGDGIRNPNEDDSSSIILWDVNSLTPIGHPLIGHTDDVSSVAFNPESNILVSGGFDGTIILWDIKSNQSKSQVFTKLSNPIHMVAFSPDGKILASGDGKDILLWDVASGKSIGQALSGQLAVFSLDGGILATSNQNVITLWNVETLQPIGQPLIENSEFDQALDLAFSSDGLVLASRIRDSITLWDIETSQSIGQLHADFGQTASIDFSPVGDTFVEASNEGYITLWEIDFVSWLDKTCQRIGRNFTRAEWTQYFPNEEYRKTCEQWSLEPEPTS